ncbi:carcinine transporter [Papilio machaon]|uniref:carcinine transporter n=1 Tax=Papilio machaon TaxID=76193 RepID=UPI001E663EBB|nr:carcinine transporter [Papilio machaon]
MEDKVISKKIPSNNYMSEKDDISNGEVDYDQLLSSAGEFGRYQWFLFFATFPFYIFGTFSYYSQIFMTEPAQNHWCWVPELANLSEHERRTLAIPSDNDGRFGYSQCTVYSANWSDVLISGIKPNESWPTESCQNGWEFDKSEIPYPTVSSDWGWVCDKDSYQATAQSVFFLGCILGGFVVGWVADKFGRVPAAVFANIIGCIAGVASTFTTSFLEFSICRFFMGMSYDNCMMMMYLLVLEFVAPKYRTIIANLPFAIFYTLGVSALPWISLACGHWKTIGLVTSSTMALAIFTPFIVPESPRWLLSKGRVDEAINKLVKIGEVNKKEIPSKLIEQFKLSIKSEKKQKSLSSLELLKRPILRKIFITMCVVYMCCMIVFDALVRSVGSLGFDFFLSFTLVSLTEFPSLVIVAFVLDLTGRKWLTIISFSLCCIFSIATAFVGGGLQSVLCAVVARFCVNIATNTSIQWAAEMLPTPVRGSGTSIVHICGYLATVISPYVVYLETYIIWLPLVIVGSLAGLGAVLAFILPETARRDMPQTFEEAEELIRDQKLFDIPFLEKKKRETSGHINSSFQMS